jgi:hypothetical protein
MFSYEPVLTQYLDGPKITSNIRKAVGDIRQPWIEVAAISGTSMFEAKALFALGMMRRYVLSANAVLKDTRFYGFISAYALLSSSIELLGRCIHSNKDVRQHPVSCSTERLVAGLEYIKNPRLRVGVIVETNHYTDADGGYNAEDLKNLRNLVIHGSCITKTSNIKGDIELLHQLRKALYGVPLGEVEPHEGTGPLKGAIDRYYESLAVGDKDICERLASAAISPIPLKLQGGNWPFDVQLVNETKQHISKNLHLGRLPISGGHIKTKDYFQLYP